MHPVKVPTRQMKYNSFMQNTKKIPDNEHIPVYLDASVENCQERG